MQSVALTETFFIKH